MRVIVCGSRDWLDREQIANRLFDLPPGSTIVHGNAKGRSKGTQHMTDRADHYGIPLELVVDGRP